MKFRFLCMFFFSTLQLVAQPKLTILTSVYNGDRYIRHFLEEISKQTIYPDIQHILINAHSPGNEEAVILEFSEKYPNIVYRRLKKDPGLYGTWNAALKLAKADLITNANLDDRYPYDAFEILIAEFKKDPTVDLVYADSYTTSIPNQKFEGASYDTVYRAPEFSIKKILKASFIGSNPVWKKSMHDRIGYFDEFFKCAGDWEMWIRAATKGLKFKHVKQVLSLNYNDKKCLSNRRELISQRVREKRCLKKRYHIR